MSHDQTTLALDQQRIVPLTIGGKVVTYHFGVIGDKDWQKYFSSIVNLGTQREDRRESIYDESFAADELVRSAVRSVSGYAGEVSGDWKARLALSHVAAVAMVLVAVGVDTAASSEPRLSDEIEVSLTSTWSQGEGGKMQQFSGLLHRFRQPTAAQLKRFRSECARTWITGSSKEPVTHYSSRQAIAAKLYDEMIVSVDGYSVRGEPLGDDVEYICRHMDTLHKAVAALQVFQPREEVLIGTKADLVNGE